jgi:hypothetical protein
MPGSSGAADRSPLFQGFLDLFPPVFDFHREDESIRIHLDQDHPRPPGSRIDADAERFGFFLHGHIHDYREGAMSEDGGGAAIDEHPGHRGVDRIQWLSVLIQHEDRIL